MCSAANAEVVTSVRFADVVSIAGSQLLPLDGRQMDRLALLACQHLVGRLTCTPIPFQIDEVDADGRWALDRGPQPNTDESPGVLDANDRLFFMAADAGERATRADLGSDRAAAEIGIYDPIAGTTRWAYVVAYQGTAPRSPQSYVAYEPESDRVRGLRVTLGFNHGVPGYLALNGSDVLGESASTSLLDRFKVRATATFLWGLVHLSRSEEDLTTEFVAWRQGPIRVIRRQRQWVRLGWGIHSPTFGSYTYFYRDFAELPVGLYLNFPPTYFFGDITVRAFLDFRDLRGWSVLLPGVKEPVAIDGIMTPGKEALNQLPGTWFALRGPRTTLVESLTVGPSLATVRCRLLYNEAPGALQPDEVPGEEPAIGYRLDSWEHVGAGAHSLTSTSFALPSDVNVYEFMAAHGAPLQVNARSLP